LGAYSVIPANARIQLAPEGVKKNGTPACAGVTVVVRHDFALSLGIPRMRLSSSRASRQALQKMTQLSPRS